MLTLVATAAAVVLGYLASRRFVRGRLRFVDAAQTWRAPVIAGLVAWALATPLVWILPLVGPGTAVLFGLAVALGVRSGARDIRDERRITGGTS